MSKDKVSLSDALRYVEEGETDHEDWQVVAEALAREIASMTHQRDSLAEDRNDLRKEGSARIADLIAERNSLHATIEADKQTHDEAVKLIDHLRTEVDQHRSVIHSLRDEVDQLRPERDRLRETLHQVTERAEHLQIENEGLSVERRQAHEECVGLRSENDKLRATLRHTAGQLPQVRIPDPVEPTLGQIRDGLKVFVDWIEQDPGNLAFMAERDDTIARLREHLAPQPQATIKSILYEMRDKTAPDHDPVKSPRHYTAHPSGVECKDIAKHMNFPLGSAMKYIWRADLKGNALQDLDKAREYIEIEIERRREIAATQAEEAKGLDD